MKNTEMNIKNELSEISENKALTIEVSLTKSSLLKEADRFKAELLAKRKSSNELEVKREVMPGEAKAARNWDKVFEMHDFYHDLKDINPNYNEGTIWQENCQRCVPAYEMRRRGYDVTAESCPKYGDNLTYDYSSVWKNPKIFHCKGDGRKDIENKMKEWGDGARVQIRVLWHNTYGHTFVAEQVDGKTIFMDPQNPSIDASKHLCDALRDKTEFFRIDNLDVNDSILLCCKRRKYNQQEV